MGSATPSWHRFFAGVWNHLENIILLFFAAYFALRGFMGTSVEELIPVMIALLGAVAISQIRSRIQVSRVASTWQRSRTDLLLQDFPPEYTAAQSMVSHGYFFAGATMARTLPIMAPHITRILTNGGEVKILLPDPENEPLMEMIAASRPGSNAHAIRRSIKHSLASAEDLRSTGKGTLEVRTFHSVPSIGINAMDLGHPAESIMVQMYEYAPKSERAPIFFLTRADGAWFNHFRKQIDRLWESCKPSVLEPDGEHAEANPSTGN